MFLSSKASKLRIREAQNAAGTARDRQRACRRAITAAISSNGIIHHGRIAALKHGLNPFVRSAYRPSRRAPAQPAVRRAGVHSADAAFDVLRGIRSRL